jgi:cell wall-associated NlpC family hydrolase
MVKIIPALCLSLVLALAAAPAASAQARQPGAGAIDAAISWAESQLEKPMFPAADESTRFQSVFGCGWFVSNAYGTLSPHGSAFYLWESCFQHPGDWNAPRGSLVFFAVNDRNRHLGHVALSTGNGNLIEAGYGTVQAATIASENAVNAYLGWAWPPRDWPGRSNGFPTAVIVVSIAAGVAVLLCLGLLLIRFIRKGPVFPRSGRAATAR